jgi:hypothetical protein
MGSETEKLMTTCRNATQGIAERVKSNPNASMLAEAREALAEGKKALAKAAAEHEDADKRVEELPARLEPPKGGFDDRLKSGPCPGFLQSKYFK